MIWLRLCRRLLPCPHSRVARTSIVSAAIVVSTLSITPESYSAAVKWHLPLSEEGRLLLPALSAYSYRIICGADTLTIEFWNVETTQEITLTAPFNVCDTVEVIAQLVHPLVGASVALREFVTASEVAATLTQPPAPQQISPPAPGRLTIAGTKSFWADVSDRSGTRLSQGLSLTLAGELSRDVSIRGSFSDRGLRDSRLVTRRFSELENVYLEVEAPHVTGVFGSFTQRQDQFRFLSYQRRVEGLEFTVRGKSVATTTTLAIPRGNYGEYTFTTTDGNYGPTNYGVRTENLV